MGKYKRIYRVGTDSSNPWYVYMERVVTAYSFKNAEELFAEEWRKLAMEFGPSVEQGEIEDLSEKEPTFRQGSFEL